MKTLIKSKTLWINTIAIIALVVQAKYGFIIDAESQLAILAVINLILRCITSEEIEWGLK